jgi:hypothetical protein
MNPQRNILLRLKYSRILIYICALAILIFVLFAGGKHLYKIFSGGGDAIVNKNTSTEVKNAVDKVSKLMYLPEDEVPTVATIKNLDSLKNQPFYQNAKVGDMVLFYSKAKKAILYDPNSNKIVNVGAFDIIK